jgi:hypothetical protein
LGAMPLAQPTVMAIATVAIDSPPKILGRRLLPLSMFSNLVRHVEPNKARTYPTNRAEGSPVTPCYA